MAHEALSRRLFEDDVSHVTEMAAKTIGVSVNKKDWPTLDVTIDHSPKIRLRFTCDNWDDQPPSIEILNEDGSPWRGSVSGNIFNSNSHPQVRRPFICMRGSREYHSIHTDDAWENYKGKDGMTLYGILMQLNTHWRKVGK